MAVAALALFLGVPTSSFAGDRVGQQAGLFVSTESPADTPVAPLPPAAPPVSPGSSAHEAISEWWLLPLVIGLSGLGGLLFVLDRHRCFDNLD